MAKIYIHKEYTKYVFDPTSPSFLTAKKGVWKRPLSKQEQKKYNHYGRLSGLFFWLIPFTMLATIILSGLSVAVNSWFILPSIGTAFLLLPSIGGFVTFSNKQSQYLTKLADESFKYCTIELNANNRAEISKARWAFYRAQFHQ